MRQLAFIGITLGALIGTSGPALAVHFYTAQDLREHCNSENAVDRAVCGGYIIAVVDMTEYTGPSFFEFCVPDGIEAGTLMKLAAAKLNEDNAPRALSASLFLQTLFVQQFPCDE